MRYLITGGAGFVGSHLSRFLLNKKDPVGDSFLPHATHVTVLDDLSTGRVSNISELETREKNRFSFIYGSVLDADLVDECVRGADAVFHLASAVGVKLIMDEPVKTIDTIVGGTSVVLAACARYRCPVLLTSTSEVYGKSSDIPFSEDGDSLIGPPSKRRWAYAAAKSLDEFLAFAYWQQMRLPVVVVRLFNTVGPRQTGQYGMVVPRFVKQALENKSLTVYGDGKQSRCFCHVSDVVEALSVLILRNDCYGELFNVGNDVEISIEDLANFVIKRLGSDSRIEFVPYDEVYGDGFEDMEKRIPDLSKIRKAVNYSPVRDLNMIVDDVRMELSS